MPIITNSLTDFSALGSAGGGSEKEGSDVIFSALYGAVVVPENEENTALSFENPVAIVPQSDVGKCLLANALLNRDIKNDVSSEDIVGVSSVAESATVMGPDGHAEKDKSKEHHFIEMPIGEEQKEHADAGVLDALQLAVPAKTGQNARLTSNNQSPLTTQLITEIAEDLAPDYEIIEQTKTKQKAAGLEAGQHIKMQDDLPKMMAVHLNKMSALISTGRQQQRAIPDMPNTAINIADDINGLAEDLSDATALKSIRTASQILPAVRSALISGTGGDMNLATQTNSGAHTNLSTGSDSRGQFTGSSQAELRSSSVETWLEMLDTQDENWTEQLVKRVERNLANAKEGIEFELNPRFLGKLRVTLSIQQNETQLQMRTETSQAAQLITDAQARLSAMLEDAGMKLAYFNTSSQSYGAGAQRGNSGNGRQNNQKDVQSKASASNTEQNNDAIEASDSLVNIKA